MTNPTPPTEYCPPGCRTVGHDHRGKREQQPTPPKTFWDFVANPDEVIVEPTPPTEASLSAEAEQWAQTAVTQARRTMLASSRRRMAEARLKRAKVTIATLTARVSALTEALEDDKCDWHHKKWPVKVSDESACGPFLGDDRFAAFKRGTCKRARAALRGDLSTLTDEVAGLTQTDSTA